MVTCCFLKNLVPENPLAISQNCHFQMQSKEHKLARQIKKQNQYNCLVDKVYVSEESTFDISPLPASQQWLAVLIHMELKTFEYETSKVTEPYFETYVHLLYTDSNRWNVFIISDFSRIDHCSLRYSFIEDSDLNDTD